MEKNQRANDEGKIRIHATIKRARHKTGKEKISHSFSLPKEQIEWLANYQGNSSELVSRLLGEFIETIENSQPSTVKLAQKLRLLKELFEKAEDKRWWSMKAFLLNKEKYEDALRRRENIPKLAQISEERLNVDIDNENEPYVAYINSTDMPTTFTTFSGCAGKTREQVITMLRNEEAKVQSVEYQNKLNDLSYEKTLNQNIYNAYQKNSETIQQQIAEIEKQIIG